MIFKKDLKTNTLLVSLLSKTFKQNHFLKDFECFSEIYINFKLIVAVYNILIAKHARYSQLETTYAWISGFVERVYLKTAL